MKQPDLFAWTCSVCGFAAIPGDGDELMRFEILGACPGCLICPQCHAQLDDEMREAPNCGTCEACLDMKEHE